MERERGRVGEGHALVSEMGTTRIRAKSLAGQDAGWKGQFPRFETTGPAEIFEALRAFVGGADKKQAEAWRECVPLLQREVGETLRVDSRATRYSVLMEYLIPLELRRSDVVLLVNDGVLVLELKGKVKPSQADLDQVSAYARDLRSYHRECEALPVHAVLVPTGSSEPARFANGVWTCGPAALDALVAQLSGSGQGRVVTLEEFLAQDSFSPLPTLVQAARQLFQSRTIPRVWRARASTEPAVEYIAQVAHSAARDRTRHLVLVTGTPGAGKTLVGMRAVHAQYLDDLAVPRSKGRPTSAGLFLSGNQPLVSVLQYVLKEAGGGGKTFVRHIKGYLNRHIPRPESVPQEHLIVFDEAQRAFTSEKVKEIHKDWPDELVASEPSLFVKVCERIPEWSVIVGLIGTGQHIYLGEEGGLVQWRSALEGASQPSAWTVHCPASLESVFAGSAIRTTWAPELHLDTQIRFHDANDWHEIVDRVLTGPSAGEARVGEQTAAEYVRGKAFRIWLTRNLQDAKSYLSERFQDSPEARFGLLASSRDKLLRGFGIPNDFMDYRHVNVGKWFANGSEDPASCRHLASCLTEFQCQGLELDMSLLAWGSDLIRERGQWTSRFAKRFSGGAVRVKDAHGLRTNSYRVLLTRGRDGTVIYVPPDAVLDETFEFLRAAGFPVLAPETVGS